MIPVYEPITDAQEKEFLLEALSSGWISGAGPFVERFERSWAEVCQRKCAVAVTNGTAALDTAFSVLDLPPGSEVIMPDFTLIACLWAVLENGLRPVFVDADPNTWCMDVNRVEESITDSTSAILAVHIYGHPVDMDPLLDLAKKYDLAVIEDAAEAHGARYKGRICGSFGTVSIFSFYANKLVTSGEGGMLLCDDEDLANRCREYRNMGFGKRCRFKHSSFGKNYRLSNLNAAVGCAQVPKLQLLLEQKLKVAEIYYNHLEGIPDIQLPSSDSNCLNSYWMYGLVIGASHSLDNFEVIDRLLARGIGARPFFWGLHEQALDIPAYSKDSGFGAFPVSERLSRRGLYLPSTPTLTEGQIVEVVDGLKDSLGI